MKKYILFSTLVISLFNNSYGNPIESSLNCKFLKNGTEEIKLQTVMGADYDEEFTELSFGEKDNVKADVLYLPYQYGIIVSLSYGEMERSSEGEESASTQISIKNNLYTLSCVK